MPVPPGDPGYFDKVNYVIDSWAHPCEAPWYIYIETLWPAALEAFLVLITFGWDDVLRGFWRPRGLGRRTGKRKGKWRGRKIPRFPEIGDLIGSNLPGADQVKGRKWGSGGKTLWRIDTALQKTMFWWLVADVTIDFAYNWTSLLYATTWCQDSDHGRFSSHGLPSALKGSGWRLMSFETIDYRFGDCFWVVKTGNTGSKPCQITCAAGYSEWSGEGLPTEIEFKVTDSNTNETLLESGVIPADASNGFSGVLTGEFPAGTVVKCWSKHNVVGAFITDPVVVGFQN